MRGNNRVVGWEVDLTRKSALGNSLFAFILWWGVMYLFSFIVKYWLGEGYSTSSYMLYFYLSIVLFFLVWYLICIPTFWRVNLGHYPSYLKFLGINTSPKGYLYAMLFLVASIVQYALLPAHLQSPVSELVWSIQPPIVEEIIFRGFILGVLLKTFSKPFSITLSLLLFIGMHFLNGPVGMLSAGVFGLLLIGIRMHTNSILPGMVVHYFINEQILVLALPFLLYGLFIIIEVIRKRKVQGGKSIWN